MSKTKRIGIMTGGGDAPGLNGIIESVSRTLLSSHFQVVGIQNGFEGVFENKTIEIHEKDIHGLHTQAGTFLGTSNKTGIEGREKEFLKKFNTLKLEGLIVAGGDGTFRGLRLLGKNFNLIGVPKTIDNDLSGTEITFGFDTACSVVADSVEALSHTADAHERIFVVEAMGRTAGWIALGGGLASYADIILIPERPYSKKALMEFILSKKKQGKKSLMIVVSEGASPKGENPVVSFRVKGSPQEERFGGIAERLARTIEKETEWESRHIVLGHLQRSRAPTTTDRFLTLAMGVKAARLAIEEKWGQAAVYRAGQVVNADITEIMGDARLVPENHRWLALAESLGLFI